MNRNIRMTPIRAAIFLALVSSLVGVVNADTFNSIHWAGPGTTSEALKGKTVVAVSFVTWCPICNKWAPQMLDQIKLAAEDKPIVVLAIATDVDAAQAKTFMLTHSFMGANILYGADANFSKEFGVDEKNLWNYVWIDPTGKVTERGAAGAAFSGANGTKDFVVPRKISSTSNLGKLEFVSSKMSPDVKDLAWGMELGDLSPLAQISSPKMQRAFSKEDRDALLKLQSDFLGARLESAKKLSKGDIPQRLEAFDLASQLVAHFRTTAQGKESIKIVASLNGDPAFRKEMTARSQYNLAMDKGGGDDARLAKLLRAVSVHFPDTYYGDKAKKDSEEPTKKSESTAEDSSK